ncbi:hypothetical protein HRG_004948 [Hirsutella rhossiliensis]|uniref:Uncharacterized protein n=1 Tax=Hirsutella rhossiliensis TaxID=111463 RepID=A0A9P8SK92_9HYPO|nr:uncharacterized protein HRG_04948 [Hirsutella rhossiliensis]KAH0964520.1 hypothetical protein HRG_04948 [Hirsutella rhossiliensis]
MKFNSIAVIAAGLTAGALAAPTQGFSPANARCEATAADAVDDALGKKPGGLLGFLGDGLLGGITHKLGVDDYLEISNALIDSALKSPS